MLVKFIDKESPKIILEKEYPDILPLLEMVKQKVTITIFFDQSGNQRVEGRLYDYEYTLSKEETGIIQDTLLIKIDCYYNNMNN